MDPKLNEPDMFTNLIAERNRYQEAYESLLDSMKLWEGRPSLSARPVTKFQIRDAILRSINILMPIDETKPTTRGDE